MCIFHTLHAGMHSSNFRPFSQMYCFIRFQMSQYRVCLSVTSLYVSLTHSFSCIDMHMSVFVEVDGWFLGSWSFYRCMIITTLFAIWINWLCVWPEEMPKSFNLDSSAALYSQEQYCVQFFFLYKINVYCNLSVITLKNNIRVLNLNIFLSYCHKNVLTAFTRPSRLSGKKKCLCLHCFLPALKHPASCIAHKTSNV